MLTSLLLAAALAAPVPVDKAEQKRLETLWKQLDAEEPVARIRAAFTLLDEPNAVTFLKEKLPPVTASADQLKGWLKDLNSDDEKVWQAAYEQLQYFPPQLKFTPAEQVEMVTSDNGKRVLYALLCNILYTLDEHAAYRIELVVGPNGRDQSQVQIKIEYQQNGREVSSRQIGNVRPLASFHSSAWNRAELAAHVLHRIDTKASRGVLEQLASGDANAGLTGAASRLLKTTPGADRGKLRDIWLELLHSNTTDRFEHALALVNTPKAAEWLKERLPAIEASKEQMTKWLGHLDRDDSALWKEAFEKMLYFRPRIALDWRDQIDAVTTAHGRTALFGLWRGYSGTPGNLNADPDTAIGIEEKEGKKRLVLSTPGLNGKRDISRVDLEPLEEMSSPHWQRARFTIIALERMKSDEAKAVLKQLADGHPDILPTKEAKAALERLK